MRHPDSRISLLLFFIFLALFVYTFSFPKPVNMVVGVGPAFVPRVVLLAMMGLCLLLFIQGGMKARRGEIPAIEKDTGRKHIYGMAAAVVFLLMMDYVGTFVSIAVYVAVTVVMAGGRRPLTVLAMALGVPLGIYLLFTKFLEVQFPAEWLF